MSDSIHISQRLRVGAVLDSDRELEVTVDDGCDAVRAWLSRRHIFALVAHLNEVLAATDEEVKT